MTSRRATLIVLAWNRWELTKRCLDSLRQTDLDGADVIVVDNGSTDETPRELAKYGWLKVLRNPSNLGFVRGNNAGIAAADPSTDVVLLNNDLEFRQADWLTRMRDCADSSADIGIVGCRLVLPDGRLLHAGTYILPDTYWGQQIGSLEKDVGQYSERREVEGIVFACAYLKRELLEVVGALSEDYESYFEDTDYCLLARQKGFRTLLCGDVTLVHDEHGSTGRDMDKFLWTFQQSRHRFRDKWHQTLGGRYVRELYWQSIVNSPTGYAMSCRETLRALDRNRVRVIYRYVYGRGTAIPYDETGSTGDYVLDVMRGREEPSEPRAAVVYGQGDVFSRNRGRLKIGYTMLEVDGFPRDWVDSANGMDEVWVPSEFNRRGFLASGLKRPIHRVPLGVDPEHFHPGIKGHPNPLQEFLFLANFEWGERKEPWLLLKVFNEEFSAKEPVRLLCKIVNRDARVNVGDEIRKLDLKETGGKISFLFNREFPYHQLGSFYRSADCYVSASRGEGWDMPLMEAMACGLPAIATDWGAHTDFVHEGIAYLLRVKGTVPAVAKCPYYEGFSWAEPDPDHLRHLLRKIYENPLEARRRGAAAAREIAAKWTWDNTARKIVARLDALGA